MEVRIRQYKDADQQAVLDLHEAALKPTGAFIFDEELDADLLNIEEVYMQQGGDFLVGEYQGRIVSMGALKRVDETTVELKRMRVHPGMQRKGLGEAMLNALEERAAALGYSKVILDTGAVQTAAQALYEKNGYREYKRQEFKGLPSIYYEKQL